MIRSTLKRHKGSLLQAINPELNNSIDNLSYNKTSRAYKMKSNICCTITEASVLILLAFMQIIMTEASLQSNMQKLKIPSDIVPVTGYTNTIKVELNGNVIKPGDPVPARNFKNLDFQKINWDADYEAKYTLMLLDLDRKPGTNGSLNIYNQFTSVNIPGNIINGGQSIVAFDSPNVPCQPSTKHRLVMLAFRQDQNIDLADIAYISAPTGPSQRRENFKLEEFISRHRLELAAANVFLAIGEANGICSASITIHSLQSMSFGLVAMVMLTSVLAISTRRPTVLI